MAIRFELSETYEAPAERVWSALADLESWHEWMPNLVSVERLAGEGLEAGARWREVRKMFGREASEVFEVTAADPPRAFEVFVDGRLGSSKRGEYRFRHVLEPVGDGTRLTLHGEISGMSRLLEWLGRLFAGPMKKAIAGDLRALKSHVEPAS